MQRYDDLQDVSNDYFVECATAAYVIAHTLAKPLPSDEDYTPAPKVDVVLRRNDAICNTKEQAVLKGLDLHTCFGVFSIKVPNRLAEYSGSFLASVAKIDDLKHPERVIINTHLAKELMREAEYNALQIVYHSDNTHQSLLNRAINTMRPKL